MKSSMRLFSLILILGGLVVTAFGQSVRFSDNFAQGEGRPVDWKVDTANPEFWFVKDGWFRTGNGEELISQDGWSFALLNVPGSGNWLNGAIQTRFYMEQPGGKVALVGRWRDRDNHNRAELVVTPDNYTLRILKVEQGEEEELAVQLLDLAVLGLPPIRNGNASRAIVFAFQCQGSNLSVRLGDQIVARARDEEPIRGTFGLGQSRNQAAFQRVLLSSGQDILTDQSALSHVQMGSVVPLENAQTLREELEKAGFAPVFLRGPREAVTVLQGNYANMTEAEAAWKRLSEAGFNPGGIVTEEMEAQEKQEVPFGRAFRVQLASVKDIADTRDLAANLRTQGYSPTVEKVGEQYKVFVGRFPGRADATRLKDRMVQEGFQFAQVISEKELAEAPVAKTKAAPVQTVPSSVIKSTSWKQLTPSQKEEVVRLVAQERAAREGTQSMQEILELKKSIEALSEDQKKIKASLEESEYNEQQRQDKIRRLVIKINSFEAAKNFDAALAAVDQLEELDPTSPIPQLKRERIHFLKEGSFAGEKILQKKELEELGRMEDQAKQLARSQNVDDLVEARSIRQAIVTRWAANPELIERSKQEIQRLNSLITERRRMDREQEKKEAAARERMLWMGIGGVFFLFLLVTVGLYFAGRARYNRMMQQVREEAIQPLQQLQSSGQLGASSPAALEQQSEPGLLAQSDSTDAEYMIPDKQSGQGEDSGPFSTDDSDDMNDFGDMDFGGGTVEAEGAESEPAPAEEEEDEFLVDFNEPDDADSHKSTFLPKGDEESSGEDSVDELVFSFDEEGEGGEAESPKEEGPITAMEVDNSEEPMEDIVFNFDDTDTSAEESAPEPVPEPEPEEFIEPTQKIEPPTSEPPGLEPIAMGDDSQDSSQEEDSSLPDLDFNLDDMGGDDDDVLPALDEGDDDLPAMDLDFGDDEGEAGLTQMVAAGAGNALFSHAFENDKEGAFPEGWKGENTDYATLEVVSGEKGKCLKFTKTEGKGPTQFSMAFPDVTGKLQIEYDIRCDEKNKHLLGVYVEKDGNYRHSIHTVVQHTSAESENFLRVFTRSAPYQMGTWRHVCYVVDLAAGVVDGYVDNELVAEGVRMGTQTESLNTFSIRDNSETTGVLYVANLSVSQADAEA